MRLIDELKQLKDKCLEQRAARREKAVAEFRQQLPSLSAEDVLIVLPHKIRRAIEEGLVEIESVYVSDKIGKDLKEDSVATVIRSWLSDQGLVPIISNARHDSFVVGTHIGVGGLEFE
jgi:hypothetical protein